MSFCFVRQAISRQPWPNRAKVSLLPNWSLATHIVKFSKRIWSFVASLSICLISSFLMIQNLGHFTQNMELHNSSGQIPRVARYLITYSILLLIFPMHCPILLQHPNLIFCPSFALRWVVTTFMIKTRHLPGGRCV